MHFFSYTRNIANYISSKVFKRLRKYTKVDKDEFKTLNESCLKISSALFPHLIGRLYIDKHFNKESMDEMRNDMRSLVNHLKQAFEQLLNENNWLDAETKEQAISKLKAMAVNIACPDFTFNDTELEIYSNDVRLLIIN
jgi:endothelin-converting enzyme/putative endopeptidase